jgi:outer membrane protein OmpA-like peptidoglycan-associated protein
MKKNSPYLIICLAFLAGFLLANFCAAQEDAEGCKDHPLLSRMKSFYITGCEKNFDAVEFTIGPDKTVTIEGDKTVINYGLKDGAETPSELQILRNYTNAVKTLGGTVVYEETGGFTTCKLVKNNREIWVKVTPYNGATVYELTILEKGEMAQEVSANDMLEALNKDGYMALYINFDTGKYTIRPESQPIITQIVALLKNSPELKLSIEGHTDNVGNAQSNKTLSEQRAKAVMNAVVTQGVEASRLSAVGWGQEKPVADNRTEEGKAKNRRVEIVKR